MLIKVLVKRSKVNRECWCYMRECGCRWTSDRLLSILVYTCEVYGVNDVLKNVLERLVRYRIVRESKREN